LICIRRLRTEGGITQEKLAELADLNIRTHPKGIGLRMGRPDEFLRIRHRSMVAGDGKNTSQPFLGVVLDEKPACN